MLNPKFTQMIKMYKEALIVHHSAAVRSCQLGSDGGMLLYNFMAHPVCVVINQPYKSLAVLWLMYKLIYCWQQTGGDVTSACSGVFFLSQRAGGAHFHYICGEKNKQNSSPMEKDWIHSSCQIPWSVIKNDSEEFGWDSTSLTVGILA